MSRNKVHFKETVAVDIQDLEKLSKQRDYSETHEAVTTLTEDVANFLSKYLKVRKDG